MLKVILKKSSVTSKVPLVTDLDYGELALNYADGKLYYKNSSNSIDYIGSSGASTAIQNRTSNTATSLQTSFSVNYTAPYVDVFKNGVRLSQGTDYTATNGTSINLTTGAVTGDLIECIGYSATSVSIDYNNLSNKPTIDSLVPSQTGNTGKVLTTDGTNVSWTTVSSGGGGGSSVYSNQYSLTGTTSNSTETEIFVNGTSNNRMAVAANKTVYYTIDIIARENGGSNYAAFTIKSVATNVSGTVSDLGNVYEVIVARSSANISIDARADNTNKTVNLYVTGLPGTTLSWKAVVNTVEV